MLWRFDVDWVRNGIWRRAKIILFVECTGIVSCIDCVHLFLEEGKILYNMGLESTMICLDNSEWMRNGDYIPTRLAAQHDAGIDFCSY